MRRFPIRTGIISGRQLPDKAVDVLDTACARVKMSQNVKPAALDAKERELINVKAQLAALEKDRPAGVSVFGDDTAACATRMSVLEKEIVALTGKWGREKRLALAVIECRNKMNDAREKKTADKYFGKANTSRHCQSFQRSRERAPMVFPYVSASLCAQVIADWTGIPVRSMVKDEATDASCARNEA